MKTSLLSIFFILFLFGCSHTLPTAENANDRVIASEDCDDLVALFFDKNAPALEIPATSLIGKNPVLLDKMNAIKLSPVDFSQFHKDFSKIKKTAPTIRDVLIHIENRKKLVVENYDSLIMTLKELPSANTDDIKLFIQEASKARSKVAQNKQIKQIELEITASYENGKSRIPSIDTPIPLDPAHPERIDEDYYQYLKIVETLTTFQGEYGELMALAASTDKVLVRGLKFRGKVGATPTEQLIIDRIAQLEARVNKMSNDEIIDFINPHKDGLFRMAYAFLVEQNFSMTKRSEVIQKIFDMIRSKEIDLVSQNSMGQMTWSEVKAYNKPISLKLISGHGKSKSIADQLVEHKALRDVLGLESSVKLRFISPLAVVEDDAKKLIEDIGYDVIGAK